MRRRTPGLEIAALGHEVRHLAEFGIVGTQGIHRDCDLAAIVADEGDRLVPAIPRGVPRFVAHQIAVVRTGIAEIDRRILTWRRSS